MAGDISKNAEFLSGGIDVTPFRSMIKYAIDTLLPVKVVMLGSNRNEANTLYRDKLSGVLDCSVKRDRHGLFRKMHPVR